jgi:hypothetical protein
LATSFEVEIGTLVKEGLEPGTAEAVAAHDSGRVFSLHRELVVALYLSVATVVAGTGLLVRNNLDRIGPVTLIAALLVAAAVCYFTAVRRTLRGEPRTLAGDYVLLLGALLLSSAIGYAELRFRLLGEGWSRHLLLLAVVHGFTAYALDSKLVLSAALASFAGWLGVELSLGSVWQPRYATLGLGYRSLLCAAVFVGAREIHRRSSQRDFLEVFDHFAAHFAFWGALSLLFEASTRWIGATLLLALALYVGIRGFRHGRETFVLYAVGYGALGLWALEAQLIDSSLLTAVSGLVSIAGAALLLWHLRARMKETP